MPDLPLRHDAPADDLKAWFQANGRDGDVLLAFADDGVVWGRLQNGVLTTARDALGRVPGSGAELRPITLQEARLFGEHGELLVWRTENGFQSRYLGDDGYADRYDEDTLLWGDTVAERSGGFSLLREGAQGMAHAVPWPVTPGTGDRDPACPPRLVVRHLVAQDSTTGMARIAASRLVGLKDDA